MTQSLHTGGTEGQLGIELSAMPSVFRVSIQLAKALARGILLRGLYPEGP